MSTKQRISLHIIGFALVLIVTQGLAVAQSPSPSPSPKKSDYSETPVETGEKAGDYTVISSIEFGYRGLSVDGDLNKYQSDLNYKAGPRIFDSSFLLKSTDGKGGLFDSLLATSTGWGADPQGHLRVSVEQPEWYRFDATYRRFKYFRFLNTFANPNWVFSPATFSVPPKSTTGEHGFNTRVKLGDFDLTLLPKNRHIRFNVGYSPERYSGPAFINYHVGGNEFIMLSEVRSRANDFRVGADGKLGPLNLSFLQGFRRFRDDTVVDLGVTPGINLNPAAASLTSFDRNEPARGSVNYTRFSLQTLVADRLDITGRIIYSKAEQNYSFLESFTGRNWNPRITGFPPSPPGATPNILNLGQYNLTGDTERPNWLGDLGLTFQATNKFRLSNTFRIETFEINGAALFADFFSVTRGTRTDTIGFNNRNVNTNIDYRKIQNTIEGDYQFNKNYSVHLGYRYGRRRVTEAISGFNLGTNAPAAIVPESHTEENNTHAILGGFKARPFNEWTLYFDAEHGTADNVFTRIGNYNYTNIRAKSRYSPTSRVAFNLALITKDNANPSEIAGVSLEDFGVSVKSRIFSSSLDWTATSRFSISTGYNYHWINSKSIIDYFFNSVQHPLGNSLYFVRNNFFFVESVAHVAPRVTLFTAYRINKDNGQGNRIADPTGNPGTLIASYPMSFQSPEARLAIKLHHRLDWNVGYQYYNYNESPIVGPRPQNYHAHLPYTSLRIYFGRRE
ncbi:MAG TPA: MtrB/PioB family outer membrane beta-barrel protein [Pyrinomonadaceae bacterium]|nr:MtrB/PioB family outer membrane beta-barrel protein [Pyrinomonadaceae bacterium]